MSVNVNTTERTAADYLQELSDLLLGARVTDREGRALSLEEGSARGVEMILGVGGSARKMMLIGNGGSAAIVSHIQNDLCKAVGVRAMVFNDQSLLTALANDDGYETVFETPVSLWAEPGDLLLAVSSSGRSENILRGARAAADRGCNVITLSGFNAENPLRGMGDLNFYVASHVYGYVEIAHSALAHLLTDRAMMIRSEARLA
ncbi:MAG TPA: SIS domain-containing protein [Pyrinomonadaceae bacterium]